MVVRSNRVWVNDVEYIIKDNEDDDDEIPNGEVPSIDKIKFYHDAGREVASWRETTKLSVGIGNSYINLDYDKRNVWPGIEVFKGKGLLNANPWVIFEITKGNWIGATWEWLRVGQTTKSKRSVHGDHIKLSHVDRNWHPAVGQTLGFMVSGLGRNNRRNVKERSNIVSVAWK